MKRLLIRFKCRRLLNAFFYFKRLREEEGLKGVKIGLHIFYGRMKLKWQQFLEYRDKRLIKLRENLAILSIRNYYRKNSLSFSLIMKRIKKYKRRLKMNTSHSTHDKCDFMSTKTQSVKSGLFSENSSNENLKNIENLVDIVECASLTSTEFLVVEKMRKKAIHDGMIAYKIPRSKEPIAVLPYLYEKDLKDEVTPIGHYEEITFAATSRMSANRPIRYPPNKKVREKLPAIVKDAVKIAKNRKIVFNNDNLPNFTRPTASSSFSREKDPVPVKVNVMNRTIRENTTLFNQTFSGVQRISEGKQRSVSQKREGRFLRSSLDYTRPVSPKFNAPFEISMSLDARTKYKVKSNISKYYKN